MTKKPPRIRRIGDSQDLLGESPCWMTGAAPSQDRLCWIDSLAGTLWRCQPDTAAMARHALPAPVGSIAPCDSGAVIAALKTGFARYDFQTRTLQHLGGTGIVHPDVRLNDGKCDPFGNFIAGTLQVNRQAGDPAQGGLYRLRPGGQVERIGEAFGLTNGPCFSLDGRTLYIADSAVRTIWAFDYSPDAPLSGQRVFVQTEALGSGPDGATVDAQGHLWTVLTRVARLARFAPDGRLERLVDMPCTHPTSLCFGGPGYASAYVTSISRSTHLRGTLAQDGGLFEVSGLPAHGVPAHRFADQASPQRP